MKLKTLTFAAAVAAAQPVVAQEWYGDLFVGGAFVPGRAFVTHEGTNSPGTPDYDIENTEVYGLTIGRQINDKWGVELEVSRRDLNTDSDYIQGGARGGTDAQQFYSLDAEAKVTTAMVNVTYTIYDEAKWRFFATGGVGYGRSKTSSQLDIRPFFNVFDASGNERAPYPERTVNNVVWNLGLGTEFRVQDNMSVLGRIRYAGYGDAITGFDQLGDRASFEDLGAFEATLGLRFKF